MLPHALLVFILLPWHEAISILLVTGTVHFPVHQEQAPVEAARINVGQLQKAALASVLIPALQVLYVEPINPDDETQGTLCHLVLREWNFRLPSQD